MTEVLLQILAVISGGLAAYFWWRSTQIEPPKEMGVATFASDSDPFGDNSVKQWAKSIGRRNAVAAGWSAVAIGFQTASLAIALVHKTGAL